MAATRDQDRASHIRSPSRIAQFSPFRRGIAARTSSADNSTSNATIAPRVAGIGLGNVSDVPTLAKASAPSKPPKPAGLRVKKAKALSISLLTGNSGAGSASSSSNNEAFHSDASTTPAHKRQTQVLLPFSPPIQQLQSNENINDTIPTRSQSAMGFYKEFGPQKGLASRAWNDFDRKNGLYSKKKKLSEENGDENEYGRRSNDLFVVSRRPSDSPSIVSESASKPYKSYNDLDYINRERAMPRSQSSLGMNSSDFVRSSSGNAVSSTSRAQRDFSDGNSGKKKGTPSPLSISSLTRRGSHSNLLERTPNSAPLASSSSNIPRPIQSPPKSYHTRTSSISTQDALTSYLPRTSPRNRTQSHADVLESKPLSAPSASSNGRGPLPPPPRHKHSKTAGHEGTLLRVPSNHLGEDRLHPRSSSPFERGNALQALGQQLGGIGAAVGKRGWDMMKSWNSSGPPSPLSLHSPRSPPSAATPLNDATRKWIAAPEPVSSIPTRGGAVITPGRVVSQSGTTGGVFGRSLRDAVLHTRLSKGKASARLSNAQLSALDLGSEFSINLPDLAGEKGSSPKQRVTVNRQVARQQYLPAVVVRCVEAIEKWGVEEEGIYRLSGRSSHTAKLKMIFDNSNNHAADLKLVDIGPADLDLNSVCSLLKAYLRSLPDLLLTSALSSDFNEAVRGACGMNAVSEMAIGQNQGQGSSTTSTSAPSSPGSQSQRVARAIAPLMNKLPAVNWYLLREIAYHLGDLTREENVRKTKMTLANLCLVLAPTLSLSVAMVRMLVEAREELFTGTCPLPDGDLDEDQVCEDWMPPVPNRPAQGSQESPSVDHVVSPRTRDDEWVKRRSVATVREPMDADKRDSTSSMATIQEATLKAADPVLQSTSDIYNLAGYTMSIRASSFIPDDIDDDKADLNAPPIAAQYLRKRSSSIANSIASTQSSQSRSIQISNLPSSSSLYSNGVYNGSTFDSSIPSSSDRGSPRTADGHWHMPISTSGKSSSSSGSLSSNYKSSGALDRPRPTTPNPMRFFSSASRK